MPSQDYFATVAADWDRLRAGFFPEAVRAHALALARVRAGRTAADLGAGTGFVTQALLEAGLTVFAVDRSPEMLAGLRARFPAAAQAGRLTALEGEAHRLPLPDASVDHAFANMLLHHVDDPARAIAEMTRILRPGGRLVLTDLDAHTHQYLVDEHHDRWPGFRRGDVAAWLAAAGLDAPHVASSGESCCCEPTNRESGCCAPVGCEPGVCAPTPEPGQGGVSIFVASGRKPVLGIRPADADALAVGRRARALFDAAPNLLCAESVFQAVAEGLGVDSPLAPRAATGFCSGLARTDGLCGAFSGGVLGLGLALGRDSGRDDLDAPYEAVQAYREFFLSRFGHVACTAICGCRLDTDEGRKAFGPSGAKARCLDVVEQAAAQVVRILRER
jgi:C_GCAxxG_C_C family probable redox protein